MKVVHICKQENHSGGIDTEFSHSEESIAREVLLASSAAAATRRNPPPQVKREIFLFLSHFKAFKWFYNRILSSVTSISTTRRPENRTRTCGSLLALISVCRPVSTTTSLTYTTPTTEATNLSILTLASMTILLHPRRPHNSSSPTDSSTAKVSNANVFSILFCVQYKLQCVVQMLDAEKVDLSNSPQTTASPLCWLIRPRPHPLVRPCSLKFNVFVRTIQ